MSRTLAREDAFKMIFEIRITGSQPEDVISYLCETASEDNDMWALNHVSEEDLSYIRSVVGGIEEQLDEINSIISKNLIKWDIGRLSKTTLSILQLAVYEIKYIDNIPNKVAANEAVNLAKKYGENNSPAFINGILASVIKEVENG